MTDLIDLAAAERRDLADYLDTLTEDEWEQQSLCSGWTVRDVVAHVSSFDVLSWPALFAVFARTRFSLTRCNQAGVDDARPLSTAQLIARLRTHTVPRGLTTMFGSAVALTDALVHQQDIRRALDHPRTVPAQRLVEVLNFAPRAHSLPAPSNMRRLRFVATDVDWSHGEGPEVTGPAEALLMALVGRQPGLVDLAGPGLPILTKRVVAHGELG